MTLSNDFPISTPENDLYGVDPFARAIAKSIEGMNAADGFVLAINGPWGSGKSSTINLVRHHLKGAIDRKEIVPVVFNPWWFSGTDALTLAFFQQLGIAIGQTLSDKVRKSLGKVGSGVSTVGSFLGALADLKAPGLGTVVAGGASLLKKVTSSTRTIEQELEVVSQALKAQSRRFLVIIDDLDRLNPDDALTMFRLVKSVGRLPNVIYLLSFDRGLAEKLVSERFPSEGPNYLEKIIQGAFDVPPPLPDLLRNHTLATAEKIMGEVPNRSTIRFMNVFFDIVAPTLSTPRDVVRLENDLRVTWPAVSGEVDRADFFALSALKIVNHPLYRAIRAHGDDLCGVDTDDGNRRNREDLSARYDRMLGLTSGESNYQQTRTALMRLFPRLQGVWSNVLASADDRYDAQRRLCSRKHFPTYFAFAVSEDTLSARVIQEVIDRAEDASFVQDFFRERLKHPRRDGSTQAALALEEITIRTKEIPEAKVAPFVSTLFRLADELDVQSDQARGFGFSDNQLRIHWLINRLVTDRFELARRDEIYSAAMVNAPVDWACDFARRCLRPYQPDRKEDREIPIIVSEAVANTFQSSAVKRLRDAANDGSLLTKRLLGRLLIQWERWTSADEVKTWTDKSLADDAFILAVANAAISVGWSQGIDDRVARATTNVRIDGLKSVLDLDRFEQRIKEIADRPNLLPEQRQIVDTYRTAPRGDALSDNRDDDD